MTTLSGSISGTPRTSSKGFANAKAALAEIDKRIAKRMGEAGWIEVLPPFEDVVDLSPRIEGLDPDKVERRKRVPNTLRVDGVGAALPCDRKTAPPHKEAAASPLVCGGGPWGHAKTCESAAS